MITPDNITMHELIGLDAKVTNSTNSGLIGLNGRVIDETKSMIKISTSKGIKSVPKSSNDWEFSVDGNSISINGSKIAKRPFDRLGARA